MLRRLPDNMKSDQLLWENDESARLLEEFGTLQSFHYMGIDKSDPNKVDVFETIFSKAGAKTISLALYRDYSVGTFRFITTSESINKLLGKSKNSR